MPFAKDGRFCDNCAKNIVDLTNKTDAELIAFFKKKKTNVCGRLLSTQLNRDLILPVEKPNWYWLMPIALGASMLSPVKSMGFERANTADTHQFLSNESLKKQPNSALTPLIEVVNGNVVDLRTGKPLQGVKIKLKEFSNVVAITDSAGNFSIALAEEQKNSLIILEKAGYENIEIKMTTNMVVKMKDVRIIRLGGVRSIAFRDHHCI